MNDQAQDRPQGDVEPVDPTYSVTHHPICLDHGYDWCAMDKLHKYTRVPRDELYSVVVLPDKPVVYSLMSLAARKVRILATRETVEKLPTELRDFLQSYMMWPIQVGIFNPIRAWHANGRIKRETHVKSEETSQGTKWVRHGPHREWTEEGVLCVASGYSNSELHGESTSWGWHGEVISHGVWDRGEPRGKHTSWWYGSSDMSVIEYLSDNHTQENRYCLATGMRIYSATRINGLEDGIVRKWARNGILVDWAKYDEGSIEGLHVTMDPSGRYHAQVRLHDRDGYTVCAHSDTPSILSGQVDKSVIRSTCWSYTPPKIPPLPDKYVTTEIALEKARWRRERTYWPGKKYHTRVTWGRAG